jgi:hypothetical protein
MPSRTAPSCLAPGQSLREELRTTFEQVFRTVAIAYDHGVMNTAQVRRLHHTTFKPGAPSKVKSVHTAVALIEKYREIDSEIKSMMSARAPEECDSDLQATVTIDAAVTENTSLDDFNACHNVANVACTTNNEDQQCGESTAPEPNLQACEVASPALRLEEALGAIQHLTSESTVRGRPLRRRGSMTERIRSIPRKSRTASSAAEESAAKRAQFEQQLQMMRVAGGIVHHGLSARAALEESGVEVTAASRRVTEHPKPATAEHLKTGHGT